MFSRCAAAATPAQRQAQGLAAGRRHAGLKGSAGVGKAVGYNMSSFTNSPVNGLLYVRGTLGEAAHQPLLAPPLPLIEAAAQLLHA